MKKLRVGVVGLGIGKKHIRGYRAHPRADVVALCDIDQQRLHAADEKYPGLRLFTSAEEMLAGAELDVVSIATPNKFHKPLAVAAFAAGCHVLCEKPISLNADESREMIQAAREAEKRLMINYTYRFTEPARSLKKQVDAGLLGDVYFARTVWHRRCGLPGFGGWFGKKSFSGGGPLIDLGVHRLDLALWLMSFPTPSWVLGGTYNAIASELARRKKKLFDVEDLAVALIRFENGAMLEIETSWVAHIAERELMETRLLGTRGGLVHRNLDEGYEFEAECYYERDGCRFDTKLRPVESEPVSSMFHLIDAVVNDRPHTATGEEGLVVMQILDAIYRSAELGEPVQIAPCSGDIEPQMDTDKH